MRKTKKEYCTNLSEKNVADKSKFWKTVKPFLFDKVKSQENLTSVKNDKIILQDIKAAEELISFFSIVVKKLKILEFREINPLAERITNLTLKSKLKYRKHSRIIAIVDLNVRSHVRFTLDSVDKEIKNINSRSKPVSEFLARVLKENVDIFADYISGILTNL